MYHEQRRVLLTASAGMLGVTIWILLEGMLVVVFVQRCLSTVRLPPTWYGF